MTENTKQEVVNAVHVALAEFLAPLAEKIVEAIPAQSITASDDGRTDELLTELVSAVERIESAASNVSNDIESAVSDIQSGVSDLSYISIDEDAVGEAVDAADQLKKNLLG
jgi:hypothetical protein